MADNKICINKIGGGKRDLPVDVAKGIAMLTVIWMHVGNNIPKEYSVSWINGIIGCLYMPCFFILSGFFIKDEPFLVFLKKKIKALLLPLFFTYILSYIIAFGCSVAIPTLLKNDVSFWNLFLSENFTNGPIWFLSALFFALLILFCINKLSNEYYKLFAVFSISVLGFYWNSLFSFRLPLFFDTGLTAVLFVYAGKYVRKLLDKIDDRRILCCAGLLALLAINFWGKSCSMQSNLYSAPFISFYVSAIVGSLGVIFISKGIEENRLLQYVGRNSLVVLCFHMFVVMGVAFTVKKMLIEGFLAYVVCFVISVALSITIVPIIKKIFKFVF